MNRCAKCRSENPEGVGVCRMCATPLKGGRGLFVRLLGWLGRALTTQTSRRVTTKIRIDESPAVHVESSRFSSDIESLPPEVRKLVEEARRGNPDATIRIEAVSTTPSERVTITEGGVTRTYDSWEEMPPDVRERCMELRGRNAGAAGPETGVTVEVDGVKRTYGSLDEVPADLRARIDALRDMKKGELDRP